jgi:hypothetical protein
MICAFLATFTEHEWLTAYASVGLLMVTIWAAFKVNEHTIYTHKQNDRLIAEEIYKDYKLALDDAHFGEEGEYSNYALNRFIDARNKALLYGLNDIEKLLDLRIQMLRDGNTLIEEVKENPLKADSLIAHERIFLGQDLRLKELSIFRERLGVKNDL